MKSFSKLKSKVMTAEEAAHLIAPGSNIGTSGFTPSGYPKAVPEALAKRIRMEHLKNVDFKIGLWTGASTGKEIDSVLARAGAIDTRFPYQSDKALRDEINSGTVKYVDIHLSHMPQYVAYGFLGNLDIAIIEAVDVTDDGKIYLTTAVGNSPTFVAKAQKIIIEINHFHDDGLKGMHDIYMLDPPPDRRPIPIYDVSQRIGVPFIQCSPEKIIAIVETNLMDHAEPFRPPDSDSKHIAGHIIDFLGNEIKHGRLPENLLPLQSGVGNVANAVLAGLIDSKLENLEVWTEVIQDSILDIVDAGKLKVATGTSLTLSPEAIKRFYKDFYRYREKFILRPQEISNHPAIIRQLGILAMNTAVEADIFGNVNSTHVMGCQMLNGIGGSGDFCRNAFISFFMTPSVAKEGKISSIVPMVSHVDHTEHDVQIIVSEQGLADLRGLAPRDRAKQIIEKCAHPDYRPLLREYLRKGLEKAPAKHTPHLLDECFSFHVNYLKTGSMLPQK
jgi:succinyl-CoA:acetate CoA-transferase